MEKGKVDEAESQAKSAIGSRGDSVCHCALVFCFAVDIVVIRRILLLLDDQTFRRPQCDFGTASESDSDDKVAVFNVVEVAIAIAVGRCLIELPCAERVVAE